MNGGIRKRFALIAVTVLALLFATLVAALLFWRFKFVVDNRGPEVNSDALYSYVIIADDERSSFWDHVYQGASEYGASHQAYVHVMGSDLAANYSKDQLFEIAIDSKVSGIIVEGTESPEQIALINRAAENKIPVITMINDSYGSNRLSFVGIGNYNLGREYAREVIKIANKNTKNVLMLCDEAYDDMTQNLLVNGFNETISNEGNHLTFENELVTLDNKNVFDSQVTINSILNRDELPEIIICFNENATVTAYQAVVEHNLVGKVKIIGYYVSDTILNAIDKEVISATIYLSAEDMGSTAIKALNEYQTTGRVSDYITIEAKVIDKNNVEEYLNHEK